MKHLMQSLEEIEALGNYPRIDTINGQLDREVEVNGEKYLLFSSNSYLGLSITNRSKEAAIAAIRKYGTGSGASRVVSGTFDIHTKLEEEIAKFKGVEAAMVLTSGYSTNVSLIPALANIFSIKGGEKDVRTIIYSDELNHASLIDGIQLANVEVIVYPHLDLVTLESKLQENINARKIIVTDSIFSMDGDYAQLDKLVELKNKFNAMIMIDEAHATGVIGENGKGLASFFGVTNDIDVIMGTFSKAFGSIGAYVAGSKKLIKLLKVAVRGYVFSTSLPPADIAVSLEIIKVLKENPLLGKKLLEMSDYLRNELEKNDFSTLGSKTQIVPILIGDIMRGIKFQSLLRENHIIAPCIQWPAVSRDKTRIRFSLMSSHTKDDVDKLLKACISSRKKLEA